MPPAARDARSAAAPSRAPWPTPSRPTKPPAQQNAAATDAAQPFVQAPSPPPSARRSCARPASSGQCNSRAAARRDPRGRSHSQSHRQTPQIAIHYRLKSGDHPYWVLSQKRESSPIIDSLHFQLRLSDSVVLELLPVHSNHCRSSRGLMVRDARKRAPHHEGPRPHPEERPSGRASRGPVGRVSKDEAIEVEIALEES